MKEVVARSKEFVLNYDFEDRSYSVNDSASIEVTGLELTGYGYPKAPEGKWSWISGAWEKIVAAQPKKERKKNSVDLNSDPKKPPVDLCGNCTKSLAEESHYHTRTSGAAGALENICCDCATALGYTCDNR